MTDTITISVWEATHKQLRVFACKCPRWAEYCEQAGVNAGSVKKFQLKAYLTEWEGIDEITVTESDGDASTGSGADVPGGEGKPSEGEPSEGKPEPSDGPPKGKPEPSEAEASNEGKSALEDLFDEAVRKEAEKIAEERDDASGPQTTVWVKKEGEPDKKIQDLLHYKFTLLMSAAMARVPVIMVGPAGCGKTHVCKQAAEALEMAFYVSGAVASEFKLIGFKDAYGNYQSTPYREAFENGGLFSWDEFDRSVPAALMGSNSGIANGVQDFPDAIVNRSPDMAMIATANTFGRGADRQYVTANTIDAATRDRFVTIEWDYDLGIEAALHGLERPKGAPEPIKLNKGAPKDFNKTWFNRVMAQRKAYEKYKIEEVVSTRAITYGIKLAEAGWPIEHIEEGILWRGLDKNNRSKVANLVKNISPVAL